MPRNENSTVLCHRGKKLGDATASSSAASRMAASSKVSSPSSAPPGVAHQLRPPSSYSKRSTAPLRGSITSRRAARRGVGSIRWSLTRDSRTSGQSAPMSTPSRIDGAFRLRDYRPRVVERFAAVRDGPVGCSNRAFGVSACDRISRGPLEQPTTNGHAQGRGDDRFGPRNETQTERSLSTVRDMDSMRSLAEATKVPIHWIAGASTTPFVGCRSVQRMNLRAVVATGNARGHT